MPIPSSLVKRESRLAKLLLRIDFFMKAGVWFDQRDRDALAAVVKELRRELDRRYAEQEQ